MSRVVVLGAGIVGTAAAWDLGRRGHEVVVTDRDPAAAATAGEVADVETGVVDVADADAVARVLGNADLVVAAVDYRFGVSLAGAAIAAGAHYVDFGGNPSVVARQLALHGAAHERGVAIVPDCGLAPGWANVIAEELIAEVEGGPVSSVQIRVGALPQHPVGVLGYQLAFSPAGLINEYAEPCEVIDNGVATTVEPLDRFEDVEWPGRGPLEAFSTAGGTSTMCARYAGRIDRLEYKTLRYPGHGRVFAALRELGFFEEEPRDLEGVSVPPRHVLIGLLAKHLPKGGPDLVLVRVTVTTPDRTLIAEVEDEHDGAFSALARTTAFPATALAHLLVGGDVTAPGVQTMHQATPPGALEPLLAGRDLSVRRR